MTKFRPICPICKNRKVAINRYFNNQVYYRKMCDVCRRAGKTAKPPPPLWVKAGYKMKQKCDRCGFTATNIKTQMKVYYVDGNLKNNDWTNLKTICLNCQAVIQDSKITWKPADLVADF
jgi:hypothetical protein